MKQLLTALVAIITLTGFSQATNIIITNPVARQVIHGTYNASDFVSSLPITDHQQIAQGINASVCPDSLKAYIIKLSTFQNRNTSSDTVSNTTGIGAARRWAYSKFQQFSAANENRLIPSYLQFDQTICTADQHRNVLAVLPGTDPANHQVIIIEGHFDSRCNVVCDKNCVAQGIEDNASGTALVMELARVMSKYTYKNTIVFMLTTAEEQALNGATAMSSYIAANSIPLKLVNNNDVIGGIICGKTSSAPSCPGLNDIDSLQVRFFTYGGFNSKHKQLARFTKLQYKEELLPHVAVPMMLTVMSAEDRTGRGGDHIPFRQSGYTAMRFTSANEHGDASNGSGYTDRQHTSRDILGVDTDANSSIDSFFVDFNYLSRNTMINGVAVAMAAIGPDAPDFDMQGINPGPGLDIRIIDSTPDPLYRIAIRTTTNDWDTLYTTDQLRDTIYPAMAANYYVSVCSVDNHGVESLFSKEIALTTSQIGLDELEKSGLPVELLQNTPNPFDEATIIGVKINAPLTYKHASIVIRDINGKTLQKLPIDLTSEINEVIYEHGYNQVGTYIYTLVIDGKEITSRRMIFNN